MKLENQMVDYSVTDDSMRVGSYTTANNTLGYNWYREYWQPYYADYYRVYPTYVQSEDKFQKAFSIAKLLLKKNLLVSRKLKDFIALVEEIAKEL